MDEIAAAAQTSKSMFYRYFSVKTGLQAAVGELVLADIEAVLLEAAHYAGGASESLRAMIAAYLAWIGTAPYVYRFVHQPASDAAAALRNCLEAITTRVQ